MPKKLAKEDVPNKIVLKALKWVRRYVKTSRYPTDHYITIDTWLLNLYTHNNIVCADLYDAENNVFTLISWKLSWEDEEQEDYYDC
jgi:hypothetical protein